MVLRTALHRFLTSIVVLVKVTVFEGKDIFVEFVGFASFFVVDLVRGFSASSIC